jgi:tellurite methyltransferase
MSDHRHDDPPSPLVERWSADLLASVPPRRRALDIAMGRGRHARLLADAGYSVFGVDWQIDAVRDAAARTGRDRLHAWVADLTSYPLPHEAFELIVVTRYLQRDLFPAIAAALVPGGVILYETFTTRQRALGWGPKSPDHLLEPGELQTRLRDAGLIELFSEETVAPEAVARFVGRRPA